ncbi:hypothetical protein LYSHEL_19620 [Lysobacter helvus]|uniref:Secreted protein n=2 Tax=Lysobacteraceae TaxID=32033 RepID=A0ABN6FVH2_9GAMM|nr:MULTISPECIES: hypothetical protein [Lysobacter]BCT92939.1 hypothetical protein LYSCAS_19630 [Lysobacter caseinilyticus]BCT96091.1 hypothetical protein LYSHEL_19620 [Lysobacter helvus]
MNRLLSLAGLTLVLASPAAFAKGKVDCNLRFNMSGWSVLYKTASGSGTITCDNGQKMNVTVSAKGGGLSVGKQKIEGGTGDFSGVSDIKETLGSYASAEAHAGAAKSGTAQVMVKGDTELKLAGAGKGWDVGITFGKFTIAKAK